MFEKVWAVYFSGTGNTEKVVKLIGNTIGKKRNLPVEVFDFTTPAKRKETPSFSSGDIVVFGMPVIAGRVPNLMLEYVKSIKGNGAMAAPVVTFGNRDFDDGLIELRDILQDDGFITVAAGAFAGEHSFSDTLGKGRPDGDDLKLAEKLGHIISNISIKREQGVKPETPVKVPGHERPYRDYYRPVDDKGNHIDIRRVKPVTDSEKCTDCKKCAEICPLGSINYENVSEVTGICMKCCGCIKKCPNGAKYFDDPGYLYHRHQIEKMYERYKESQIFSKEV